MYTKACDIKVGDIVDLEGDAYADVDPWVVLHENEFAKVLGTERETEGCVRLDFDHESFGFPPDHQIYVVGVEPFDEGED